MFSRYYIILFCLFIGPSVAIKPLTNNKEAIKNLIIRNKNKGSFSPLLPLKTVIKKEKGKAVKKKLTWYKKNKIAIRNTSVFLGCLWFFNGFFNFIDGSYETPEEMNKIKNLMVPFHYEGPVDFIFEIEKDKDFANCIKQNNYRKTEILMTQFVGCNKENTGILGEIQKDMKKDKKIFKYNGPLLTAQGQHYRTLSIFIKEMEDEIIGYLEKKTGLKKDILLKKKFFYKTHFIANAPIQSITLADMLTVKKDEKAETMEINNTNLLLLLLGNYLMKQEDMFASKVLDTIIDGFNQHPSSEKYYQETLTENYENIGFFKKTQLQTKKFFKSFFYFKPLAF